MPDTLEAAVSSLGIDLTAEQLERLRVYRDLLEATSREFNLTSQSLQSSGQIERRHIIESLAYGTLLQRNHLLDAAPRVVDIGTGAGLPGIPLRIAWPDVDLVLLESVGKKCRFLEDVVEHLNLARVAVVEARAEDFGRDPARRESFDLVIARAVASLPVLLEYSLPLLRIGGHLAATKGSAAIGEIDASARALEVLGGRFVDNAPFNPPEGTSLTVVIIEKVAPTPAQYPRRAGIPSKRPL